jgi:hypothetical protein
MNRVHTMARTELYEKVWKIPMQKLATEFGLSDVGLAKLCKRHQIPVPGRGYWARIQFGQKLKQIALPVPANSTIETIRIVASEKRLASNEEPRDEQPTPTIEVSSDRPITHRLILRMDNSILRGKKDERGLPLTRRGRVLPLHVSLDTLPRALRILDTLFVALDTAGYKIEWPSPYNTRIDVISLDEKVGLSISEIIERKQHKMTEDEISWQKTDRWWTAPRWDYMRTGRLKFVVDSVEVPHLQHAWADRKKQKLENCVGEIFVAFEKTANAVKTYRQDCAEAARQRAEEQIRAEKQRRKEEEYNRKFDVLSKHAEAWRKANQLREFAASLKESAKSPAVSLTQKAGIVRILDWIERHANFVDPLTDVSGMIRRFEKPDWHYY